MVRPARPHDPARRGWRVTALLIGALVAALLLAVALIFSSAVGTARIADASRNLQWANSTATAAAVTRAATAQAVVFAIDEALGVADAAAVSAAVDEVDTNLAMLLRWMRAAPPSTDGRLLDALDALVDETDQVLLLVADGRPADADAVRTGSFDTAYVAAMEQLAEVQTTHAAAITDSEAIAGRVAMITRTIVVLLIPMAAILVYRFLARTELRRRRAAMHARIDAAEELSRSKDDFIAGISHELRTPLTSIYGFSQHLLDNGVIDASEAMELIALINSDSAELSRMVEDLLTAARLDSDSLEFSIDAISIQGEIASVAAPLRRAGHDIALPTGDHAVWADRVRLRQVLRNLVSNAVRHGGGPIRISVDGDDDVVRCEVADGGPGVASQVEPRMFERFVHDGKTTLLTGSVGLGLAISKSLAEAMGGDLSYERRDGWTVFTLTLPAAPASLMTEAAPAILAGESASTGGGAGEFELTLSLGDAEPEVPRIRFG